MTLQHCANTLSGSTATYLWREQVTNIADVAYVRLIFNGLQAANKLLSTLFRANLWLSTSERDIVILSLDRLLDCFQKAASHAFSRKLCRFKLQPKSHMVGEIKYKLVCDRRKGCKSLNPIAFATQLDEDFAGRLRAFSRVVSSRTMAAKVIKRYKVALMSAWWGKKPGEMMWSKFYRYKKNESHHFNEDKNEKVPLSLVTFYNSHLDQGRHSITMQSSCASTYLSRTELRFFSSTTPTRRRWSCWTGLGTPQQAERFLGVEGPDQGGKSRESHA